MKKSTKLFALISALIVTVLLFSVSAFATEEAAAATTLKVKNAQSGITLSWNASEGVKHYSIYRKSKNDLTISHLTDATTTTYTDETTLPATLYSYSVVPVFNDGTTGAKSNDAVYYHIPSPEIIKKASVKDGLGIRWTLVDGAKQYYVYRRSTSQTEWKCIGKTDNKTDTYIDKNVNTKDEYTYAVRAYNSKYYSLESNFVSAYFLAAAKITKILPCDGSIGFCWSKVNNATHYVIYRATSQNKKYVAYRTVEASTRVFYDKDVKSGVFYGYIVRAVDADKSFGGYESATICKYLSKPVIKSISNESSGVKLTWTASAGSQGYAVYRRDASGTTWKLLGLVKGQNTLTATDKAAKNGSSYVYVVRAVYSGTYSAYDISGASIRFLAPPTNLKAVSKATGGNTLSWTANKYAKKYYVYRKYASGSWELLGSTTKNPVTDKTAVSGRVYSYAVRAYLDSKCYSGASNIALSSGINPNGKMVALTYDDGPSNSVTNDILDILSRYDSKATFFVVGNRIESNYQPMQRAVKMGCEIGNHTYSHIDLPSSSSYEIKQEISLTDSLVKKYTGVTPKLARAPGGATDSYSASIVGKPFMYWSVDTRDWESRDADSIIENVKYYTEDGSIILMHDIYDSTAEASEVIIPWLKNQGYQLVTVSEMMQYRGIKLQAGVTYYDAYR